MLQSVALWVFPERADRSLHRVVIRWTDMPPKLVTLTNVTVQNSLQRLFADGRFPYSSNYRLNEAAPHSERHFQRHEIGTVRLQMCVYRCALPILNNMAKRLCIHVLLYTFT